MTHSSDELRLEEHMALAQRKVAFQVAVDSNSGFTAHATGHPIFVQGESIEQLNNAAADALLCHFGSTKPLPQFELRFDYDDAQQA